MSGPRSFSTGALAELGPHLFRWSIEKLRAGYLRGRGRPFRTALPQGVIRERIAVWAAVHLPLETQERLRPLAKRVVSLKDRVAQRSRR